MKFLYFSYNIWTKYVSQESQIWFAWMKKHLLWFRRVSGGLNTILLNSKLLANRGMSFKFVLSNWCGNFKQERTLERINYCHNTDTSAVANMFKEFNLDLFMIFQ